MGSKVHTALVTIVYFGMAICLTGLLSTALIENFPHQVFGITFFALLVCHLVLNRFWIRHSLSGRWDFKRVLFLVVVIALALLSIAQAINCILLSSFFWSMLPHDFAFFSSSLHMTLGTWIFTLAAVHFGLNANALIGNKLRYHRPDCAHTDTRKRKMLVVIAWIALFAISIYGIVEFFDLQMPNYLFMIGGAQAETNVPLAARFLQYLCVGIAIASMTHCLSALVQKQARKYVGEAQFEVQ